MPERPPERSLSAGGFMLRRLLPGIAAVLFITGALCLQGEETGLYGPEMAVGLMALAGTAACAALIAWNTRALQRIDAERLRAEAAALEPQERFARFMRNLPGLAFIKDAEGRYVFANASFESVFGLGPSGWTGRTDAEIFPAGTAAQFVANDRTVLETGQVLQTVEVAPQADGPHHSIVVKFPIPGRDGRPLLLGGVAVDITERRRAEETLRRSEQHLQLAVGAAELGTWRLETATGRIDASARCKSQFGWPPDDAVTYDSFLQSVHPDDRGRVNAAMRIALETGADYVAEYRALWPDGSVRWISAAGRGVGPAPPAEVVGVTQDITGRKRDEERLRDENRLIETLNRIGAVVSGELELDKLVQAVTDEGVKLTEARFGAFFYNMVNERGECYTLYSLAGAPREAFAKFPLPRNTAVFEPTFRGRGVVRLDDVTRDPRYGRNDPYHGMPEGHLSVRSYLAVPVVSRTGAVLGGLFFGHPEAGVFTERHERLIVGVAAQAAVAIDNARLYREAKQANRTKDEFLAVVSHELRTPLNAILGWSQLLRSGSLAPDEARHGLDVIDRSVKAQTQIIADLLDVSRIVAGKLVLEMKPASLLSVIDGAIESVRLPAEARNLTVETVFDRAADRVSGDADRLRQVVSNLLSNAVKFTPAGGRIEVRLARCQDNARITVSDTGKGISPDFLPHVFERFRQADDAATRRRHGGLGLGLAIVRHLVELHRGTVRVESAGEGRGATFTVELPLAGSEASGPEDVRTPVGAADLGGLKVLAVDDEADARELLAMLLRRHGAEVRTAASVPEALMGLELWRPDVLLSDIGMPNQDGYELIASVRALPADRGGRIPAAALTAFAGSGDRDRLLAAGFHMHIPKPIDPSALVVAVAGLGRTSGSNGRPA